MTGWIIYSRHDYEHNRAFAQSFVSCGKKHGVDIFPVTLDDIRFDVSATGPRFSCSLGIPYPDFVISRFREHKLSHHFELCSVPVFNNSFVSYICNDKFLTHQYLSLHSIDMMDTALVSHELFKTSPSCLPCVVKSVGGHGGSEVFMAADKNEFLHYSGMCSHGAIAQPVASVRGKDMRVYVLGREVLACVLREAESDFRSNYSLGGKVSLCTLTAEQRMVVDKVTALFDFGLVGIDFIFDNNRFVLNEIEDVVGCRMLYRVADIDPVELYLDFMLNKIRKGEALQWRHSNPLLKF